MTALEIARQFAIKGEISEVKPLGEGFINDTFKVYTKGNEAPQYILQRKNHIVFPDVPAMMDNIYRVTEHIRTKVADKERGTLTIVKANDGKLYYKTEDGNFWAVCTFIQGSKCYDRADSPELAYQGGRGLGLFHSQVNDFTEPLAEIIKGFHNIRWRFTQWDASVKADKARRVKDLAEEISWIESRREKMLAFWEKFETGVFPTRVTHNDTKISNFLFDDESGDLLCAIDLDTLMSSTVMNDVGDALRSYTNTGAEDDPDLGKVGMSMEMYKAYMEGYLSYMKDTLTKAEKDNLAFSGLYITYEQVLRFLMDYIDGDTYYKTKYPEHNLVRTRAQYKLLQSMESQHTEMQKFIDEI
ncbi:MAG: aminoglycoside phosphotransferase family protein [Bacteroidales bacterium]|nr:aminoglycoside phosphotransferase family protein [Bacteroidales bacterium]